jgi:hypothetical protein
VRTRDGVAGQARVAPEPLFDAIHRDGRTGRGRSLGRAWRVRDPRGLGHGRRAHVVGSRSRAPQAIVFRASK